MKKLLKMASYAVLPLAALMMFSSYSGGSGSECPPAGADYGFTVLLPNPEDCSTFFSCSNGVPILMNCPGGYVFNDKLDTCEPPSLDNPCISGGGSGPGVGNTEFKYRIDKDPCVITLTADIIAEGKIAKTMERMGLGIPKVNLRLDLTPLTCLYRMGGYYRLGDDVRCTDLF